MCFYGASEKRKSGGPAGHEAFFAPRGAEILSKIGRFARV